MMLLLQTCTCADCIKQSLVTVCRLRGALNAATTISVGEIRCFTLKQCWSLFGLRHKQQNGCSSLIMPKISNRMVD